MITKERLEKATNEQLEQFLTKEVSMREKRLAQDVLDERKKQEFAFASSDTFGMTDMGGIPGIEPSAYDQFMSSIKPAAMDLVEYGRGAGQGLLDMGTASLAALSGNPMPAYNMVSAMGEGLSNIPQYAQQNFGTPEAAMESFTQRPFTTMGDIAAVGLAPFTAGASMAPLMPRLGGALKKMGTATMAVDPLNVGMLAGGKVATTMNPDLAPSTVAGRYPSDPYNNASGDRLAAATRALIDRDIPPGRAGELEFDAQKQAAADDLSLQAQELDQQLAGASTTPFTVENLEARLYDMLDAKYKNRADYENMQSDIETVLDLYEGALDRAGRDFLLPSEIIDFRRSLDGVVPQGAFDPNKKSSLTAESKKVVADVFRGLINDSYPSLKAANNEYSDLMRIQDKAKRGGARDIRGGDLLEEVAANPLRPVMDVARTAVTGKTDFGRAKMYRALETGDWVGILQQMPAGPLGVGRLYGYGAFTAGSDEASWGDG